MSYLPARQNFKVFVKTTFHYRFQWLLQADNVDTPQNLTGFHGSMPITSIDGLTTYQTLTDENGGIVFNGTSGNIDLILTKEQTEALGWTSANYTLTVVNPTTHETLPLLTGRLTAVGSL
jgi:hypothetical protein